MKVTNRHIIKLMLVRAPDRIRKVILLSNNTHSLIRIIYIIWPIIKDISLDKVIAPELNVDVFTLVVARQLLLRDWNRLSIKVIAQRDAGELE